MGVPSVKVDSPLIAVRGSLAHGSTTPCHKPIEVLRPKAGYFATIWPHPQTTESVCPVAEAQ